MGEYYDFGGLYMNVKSDEERKSKVLKVRLNDREFTKLKQYTEESGLRSMSEYIYNSILATPIIGLTDEELAREIFIPKICRKYVRELRKSRQGLQNIKQSWNALP